MPKSVNEVFRDYVRFTGDGLPGEPVGWPLPYGDPSSGVHHPRKGDVREALAPVFGWAEEAKLARDQSVAASSVSGLKFVPEHFGAVGDGVADDSNAIEAALLAGFVIGKRGSVYRVTRKISITDTETTVRDVTILHDAASDCIELVHSTPKLTRWNNCKFYTNRQEPGVGLKITLAAAGVVAGRRDGFYFLENLVFVGQDQLAHGWLTGLHLHNVNMVRPRDIRVLGRRDMTAAVGSAGRSWIAGTRGILVTCDEGSDPTVVEISSAHIRHVEQGIVIDGDMEGLTIRGGQIVAVRTGALIDVTSVSQPTATQPGLWVRDVHINASQRCVDIRRMSEVEVSGCEFYRYAAVWGFNFDAIYAEAMTYSSITGNKLMLYHHLRDASETSLRSAPGLFDTIRSSKITGNIVWRASAGFSFITAATDNELGNNGFYGDGSVKETGFAPYLFSSGAVGTANRIHVSDGGQRVASAASIAVASTSTVICTVGGITAAPGERYRFTIEYQGTKAGTAGDVTFQVGKSAGTADINHPLGTWVMKQPGIGASATFSGNGVGYFSVTTGGTLSVTLYGVSVGSNATTSAVLRIERVE